MNISYIDDIQAWRGFLPLLKRLIESSGSKRIVEIGGGANPALPIDYVLEKGLEYTILDISAEELAKAPEGYHKIQADIAAKVFQFEGEYDLIFSNMLAEHVSDALCFHENIFKMLRNGGLAFHYFPTLFSLPMVINKMVSENFGQLILNKILPGLRVKTGNRGKFPAYYKWCLGPLRIQEHRLTGVGFKVLEYRGTFGYHGYFHNLKWLHRLHDLIVSVQLRFPIAVFTSGAQVLLQKGSFTGLECDYKFPKQE